MIKTNKIQKLNVSYLSKMSKSITAYKTTVIMLNQRIVLREF